MRDSLVCLKFSFLNRQNFLHQNIYIHYENFLLLVVVSQSLPGCLWASLKLLMIDVVRQINQNILWGFYFSVK